MHNIYTSILPLDIDFHIMSSNRDMDKVNTLPISARKKTIDSTKSLDEIRGGDCHFHEYYHLWQVPIDGCSMICRRLYSLTKGLKPRTNKINCVLTMLMLIMVTIMFTKYLHMIRFNGEKANKEDPVIIRRQILDETNHEYVQVFKKYFLVILPHFMAYTNSLLKV